MTERIVTASNCQKTDVELFAEWGNKLFASDADFAKTLICGIVAAEFSEVPDQDED